jgi:hypothetical protein
VNIYSKEDLQTTEKVIVAKSSSEIAGSAVERVATETERNDDMAPRVIVQPFENVEQSVQVRSTAMIRRALDGPPADFLTRYPPYGQLLSHLAAQRDERETLRWIFTVAPITLSMTDSRGETPAHAAARCGQRDVIRFLFKTVPSTFKAHDCNGNLPVHSAASSRQGLVRILVHNTQVMKTITHTIN